MMRRLRLLAIALVAVVGLSACDFDVYKLPLPGGADVGDHPMTIKVEFADVLDLVPQSSVKVNDVTVGKVTDVDLDGYQAEVTLEVRNDVDLPADAVAQIRQTSLLGEKFVSLSPPAKTTTAAKLTSGATIPISRTGRNPEVEEVFGALSLLLNGGGVGQLKTIVGELNKTLDGREGVARSVLTQIETFVGTLDANKSKITDAIEALNRVSVEVKKQQPSIDAALEELPSTLDSLDRQRDDLIHMLKALDKLSPVGIRVIKRSKASTIESLRQLQPVLTELANSGKYFVDSFSVALTYPFVDESVGRDPQVARNLHMGDYANLDINLNLDLLDLPQVGLPCTPLSAIPKLGPLPDLETICEDGQAAIQKCLSKKTLQACAGIPAYVISQLCAALPIPIPILCPSGGNKNGKGTKGGATTGGGGLGGALGGLGGLLDGLGLGGLLGRPAAWPEQLASGRSTQEIAERGPTVRQLTEQFDPALVMLLTPGMVTR